MVDYIEKIQFQGQTLPIGGDCFDDKWYNASYTLLSNASINIDASLDISLANIPLDWTNYDYELALMACINSSTTQYQWTDLFIYQEGSQWYRLCVPRSNYSGTAGESIGQIYMFVFKGNPVLKLRSGGSSNGVGSGINVYLRGYRRLAKVY